MVALEPPRKWYKIFRAAKEIPTIRQRRIRSIAIYPMFLAKVLFIWSLFLSPPNSSSPAQFAGVTHNVKPKLPLLFSSRPVPHGIFNEEE